MKSSPEGIVTSSRHEKAISSNCEKEHALLLVLRFVLPLLLLPLLVLCTPSEEEASTGQEASSPPSQPLPEQEPDGRGPLRLMLSCYMDGHLEPCGCASAQSGGLDRRAFWLNSHKASYDTLLEGGNLVSGHTPFEELKLMTILQVLGSNMGYPLLPLGHTDLELGAELLLDFDEAFGPPFIATDLRDKEGKPPFKTFGIVKAGSKEGYKLLVMSLIGHLDGEKPKKEGLSLQAPREAIAQALHAAGKRGENYDLAVVFSNSGGARLGRELARTVPGLDLVLCTDSPEDNAQSKYESFALRHEDGSRRIQRVLFVGGRGKTMLRWTGVPAKDGSWITQKAEKIRLGQPTADPEVRDVLLDFKRSLPEEGILEQMAEQRPARDGYKYVGNASCAECHPAAAKVWAKTKHAHAWESLVERGKRDHWPVTQHPECVSCHVVGYGEKSGFITITKSKHLKDVGCESCHGPGSRHTQFWEKEAATLDGTEYELAKQKGLMPKIGFNRCFHCHTLEQSPGFLPQERWKQIEHK
ncbi:MAG: hypothetical protein CSA62_11690 [Planctomycetota bacterium]|nr:MAG: hypothetical protein CSA62_11690 [Planctomycetota bacterium]